MTNSADPDQLASSYVLDLHCLLRQGMSCSAREGLRCLIQIFLKTLYPFEGPCAVNCK